MKKTILIALSTLCICSCAKKNEAPETFVGMSMDTHINVQVNDSTGKDILDSLAMKASGFKAYADATMETELKYYTPRIDTFTSDNHPIMLDLEGCYNCNMEDSVCRIEYYVTLCKDDVDTVISESVYRYTESRDNLGKLRWGGSSKTMTLFVFNGDTIMKNSDSYSHDTLNPFIIVKNGCK